MSATVYSFLRAMLIGIAFTGTVQLMMKRKARLVSGRFVLYASINTAGYFLLGWIPYPVARILVWVVVSECLWVIFFRLGKSQNILYATAVMLLAAISEAAVYVYLTTMPKAVHSFLTIYMASGLIAATASGLFLLAWNFFSKNNLGRVYRVLYARIEKIPPSVYTHMTIYTMIIISVLGLFFIYRATRDLGSLHRFSFYIPFMVLPVINLLGYILYKLAIRNKIELEEKKKKYEQLLVYTRIIEKLTRDMRRFRHDLNNILMTMSGFIDNDDMTGLREYYQREILKNNSVIMNQSGVFLNVEMIKCVPLKGLITTAFQKAMKNDIQVSIFIDDYLGETGMQTIDLCRIMGVFLDNAIEAARKSEEKTISLSIIKNEAGDISISVANSFIKKPNMSRLFKEGYSTKGEGRGTGLSSIAAIKDEYDHVTLNTVINHQYFIQELNIANPCRQ